VVYASTPNHPDIASSLNNLGVVLSALGKKEEARQYYEQALAIRRVVYASTPNHPETLRVKENLAICQSQEKPRDRSGSKKRCVIS